MKKYFYRPDNDNWEVFSIDESDDDLEDWVATVSTETVAVLLVKALSKF